MQTSHDRFEEKTARLPSARVGAAFLFALPLLIFDPAAADGFAVLPWLAFLLAAVTAALIWRPKMPPLVVLGLLPALASMTLISAGAKPIWAAAAWCAWFLLAEMKAPAAIAALRRGVVLGAVLNALFMLLQAAGMDPLFEPLPAFHDAPAGARHVTGFMGNSAAVAIFLALALPLAAVLPQRFRIPYQLLLVLAIVLSASKLPLLLAVAVLLLDLLKRGRKRWALALVAVILGAAALYTPLRDRTYNALARGALARQLETRVTEWRLAVSILTARPVWAMAGLGEYGNVERAAREEQKLPVPRGHGWFLHAHNDYLETLVEAGWIGTLLLAAAFLAWLRERRLDDTAKLTLAMFAVLMLLHDPVHRPAALLALAAALAGAPKIRENASPQRTITTWLLVLIAFTGALSMGADTLALRGILPVTPATLHWLPEGGRAQLVARARRLPPTADALPFWEAVLKAAPDPEAALAVSRIQDRTGSGSPSTTLCSVWLVTGSIVLENQLRAWSLAPRSHCLTGAGPAAQQFAE